MNAKQRVTTRPYGHDRCLTCGYQIDPGSRCSECGTDDVVRYVHRSVKSQTLRPRDVYLVLIASVLASFAGYALPWVFVLGAWIDPTIISLRVIEWGVLWLPLLTILPLLSPRIDRAFLPLAPRIGLVCAVVVYVGAAYVSRHLIVAYNTNGVAFSHKVMFVGLFEVGASFIAAGMSFFIAEGVIRSMRFDVESPRFARQSAAAGRICLTLCALCGLGTCMFGLGWWAWTFTVPLLLVGVIFTHVIAFRSVRPFTLVAVGW